MNPPTSSTVRLGLRANLLQFSLLVLVNAFVGGMVGLERTVVPLIAESDFGLLSRSVALSFLISFGVVKALSNMFAGRLSDRLGRKRILIAGWMFGLPVPLLIIFAPSWNWVVFANVLLGVNQGLCWSTTVFMKIDLVGPKQRGLAMGLNEFAGYLAVSFSALATSYLAATYRLRPEPFYPGIAFAILGLFFSIFFVRETRPHARHEAQMVAAKPAPPARGGDQQILLNPPSPHPSPLSPSLERGAGGEGGAPIPPASELSFGHILLLTSWKDRALFAASQAGLVNNLNDGMVWGLLPIFLTSAGLSLKQVGAIAAIYPGVGGLSQLATGALSDRWGRKWLIAAGMWVQAVGIGAFVVAQGFWPWVGGAILLGLGTAMVYPTLLATISDVAHPQWRASAVGVYRLWRDAGYAVGALMAGWLADAFSIPVSIAAIGGLTFLSGVVVALVMYETLPGRRARL